MTPEQIKARLDIQRYSYKPGVYDVNLKDFRPGMEPAKDSDKCS